MITVVQKPSGTQLSGNITKFIVNSDREFTMEWRVQPNAYSKPETYGLGNGIEIDLSDIITSELVINQPGDSVLFEQIGAVQNIDVKINGVIHQFAVVKGGVRDLSQTSEQFLKENFLTWQPQTKKVRTIQPEWLSYFAIQDVNVKLKAYFSDDTNEVYDLASLLSGKMHTMDLSFQRVNSLFAKQVTYYDVWVEDTGATVRLSYIQRYVLTTEYLENEQYFIFENSLSGIDTVLMLGETKSKKNPKALVGKIDGSEVEYGMDFSVTYTQNTGHIDTRDKAAWLQDFFLSQQKNLLVDGVILPIVMDKNTIKDSTRNDLRDFSFDFRLSKQSKYQNLTRNMDALPENLEIATGDDLFFLAPRLSEFPALPLSDTLTFPVQLRYTEEWGQITYATVKQDLLSAVAAMGYVPGDQVGDHVDLSGYARIDQPNVFAAQQTINANLYVNGDIIQNGSAYETHAEHLNVENNLMQLNVGEPGNQITGVIPGTTIPFSGVEINRGSAAPYYMGVVEGSKPLLKLGKKDSLVTVAAREDSITDGYAIEWDEATKRMIGVAAVRDSLKLGGLLASDYAVRSQGEYISGAWNFVSTGLQESSHSYSNLYAGNVVYRHAYPNGYDKLTKTQWNFRWSNGSGSYSVLNIGEDAFTYKNKDIYHSGNSNLSTVNWATNNLSVEGNSDVKGLVTVGAGNSGGGLWLSSSSYKIEGGPYFGDIRIKAPDRIRNYIGSTIRLELTSGGTAITGDATVSGYLGSPTYASGFAGSGWRIDSVGNGTLDSLTVRKTFNVYELNVNKIRSGNGSYWFSDGAKALDFSFDWDGRGISRIYLDKETGNPFMVGDILRCQVWTGTGIKYYYFKIDYINSDSIGEYIDSYGRTWTAPNIPEKGDELVRIGNASDTSRQGAVYITSNDNDAPYIDVLDGVTSDDLTGKQKVRLGKLDGISDSELGGALTGYGLYGQNVFLKGKIVAQSGKIGEWKIDTNSIFSGSSRWAANSITIESGSTPTIRVNGDTNHTKCVEMYYSGSTDWGIRGRTNSSSTWDFQLGSTNQIAGWTFDHTKLTSNNIEIGSSGYIRQISDKWRLNKDGDGQLASGNISWDASGNVTFGNSVKLQWESYSDASINVLEVGGTNITPLSRIGGTPTLGKYDNGTGRYKDISSAQWRISSWDYHEIGYYSLSFWVKATNAGALAVDFCDQNWTSIAVTNDWTFVKIENKYINSHYLNYIYDGFIDLNGSSLGTLYISNFKLEQGSKCTAYSQAKGDIEAQTTVITNDTLSTTNVFAQNLRVEFGNIENFTFDNASGVNVDISGVFKTTEVSYNGGLANLYIDGNDIYGVANGDREGYISINKHGANGDVSKFSNTAIGNGKGSDLFFVSGSSNQILISADLNVYGEAVFTNAATLTANVEINGVATLTNGLILSGGAVVTGAVSCTSNFVENGQYLSDKYAAKSHSHSYLPLSGGAVSGYTSFNGGLFTKKLVLKPMTATGYTSPGAGQTLNADNYSSFYVGSTAYDRYYSLTGGTDGQIVTIFNRNNTYKAYIDGIRHDMTDFVLVGGKAMILQKVNANLYDGDVSGSHWIVLAVFDNGW